MTMASERWIKGYSQSDLDRAQQRFGLVFPPDLIGMLREKRPAAGHDWNDEAARRRALSWPFEGLLFDVESNEMWWPEWGERPVKAQERCEVLRAIVSRAPKLIPLMSHRYLPQEPQSTGNPVFSVYQSDVIYYGSNLEDYFFREFQGWSARPWPGAIRRIRFWSDLVDRNA